MPARVTKDILRIDWEAGRRFNAVYANDTRKRLEAIAIIRVITQQMRDDPIVGPRPAGPPTTDYVWTGFDLRDGQWVNVRDDPDFVKLEPRSS